MKYKKMKWIAREICAGHIICSSRCPFFTTDQDCGAKFLIKRSTANHIEHVCKDYEKERKSKGKPPKGGNVAQRD
jgi:ferredoxin